MASGVQRYEQVVVSGIAHVDAPHVVTSREIDAQLEAPLARFGMHPGVLEGYAGIVERRFWDVGEQPSAGAIAAGAKALAASGVDTVGIGALVNTSVCRDYIEPSTASIVHAGLGLPPAALNFDLGNACLGFVSGMTVVAGMIEGGEIDHALVVNAEGSRHAVEQTIARLTDPTCDEATFRDSFATLTLGSGAAAMVLSRADLVEGGHPFKGGMSRAATEHHALCRGQVDEMRTDARTLLMAGLSLAKDIFPEAAERFGLTPETTASYVLHQISKVHTEATADLLGLDPEKIPLIYPHFGNIGPAGIIMTLSKEAEADRLVAGDRLALMGIGSGLNMTVAELVW